MGRWAPELKGWIEQGPAFALLIPVASRNSRVRRPRNDPCKGAEQDYQELQTGSLEVPAQNFWLQHQAPRSGHRQRKSTSAHLHAPPKDRSTPGAHIRRSLSHAASGTCGPGVRVQHRNIHSSNSLPGKACARPKHLKPLEQIHRLQRSPGIRRAASNHL